MRTLCAATARSESTKYKQNNAQRTTATVPVLELGKLQLVLFAVAVGIKRGNV